MTYGYGWDGEEIIYFDDIFQFESITTKTHFKKIDKAEFEQIMTDNSLWKYVTESQRKEFKMR